MGYYPGAVLTYGIDMPEFDAALDSWYHSDEPIEAAGQVIRNRNPANTCGLITTPDGSYRIVARYISASGGRLNSPERIPGKAIMPPETADTDLLEALAALLGVDKLTDLADVEPDWLLTADLD